MNYKGEVPANQSLEARNAKRVLPKLLLHSSIDIDIDVDIDTDKDILTHIVSLFS